MLHLCSTRPIALAALWVAVAGIAVGISAPFSAPSWAFDDTKYPDWKGQWLIIEATGGLEGLHGQGKWWGPGWQGDPEVHGVVYYSGKIHFEPSSE